MNIIVNSETEDDDSTQRNNDTQSQINIAQLTERSVQQKKKGHFRGESFGDSIALENTLTKTEF